MTLTDLRGMKRKRFFWHLKRLAEQKTDDNKAMEKASKGGSSSTPKSNGMRYLG